MSRENDNEGDMFDLVSVPKSSDEKLIIIGSTERLIPSDLILDASITGDEMRLWAILRHYASSSTQSMPTQEILARLIDKSRPTVNQGLQILRISRWLTIVQEEERNAHGRFSQLTYAIHNYQMSVADTIDLDPGYVQFLLDKSEGATRRLKQRAVDALVDVTPYYHFGTIPEVNKPESSGLLISNSPCKDSLHGGDTADTGTDQTQACELSAFDESTQEELETNLSASIAQGKSEPEKHSAPRKESIQWHRHLESLPETIRPTVLRLAQQYELKDHQIDAALKATIARIENPNLRPIGVLPKYIEKMMSKAKTGDVHIYDARTAKKNTANRKKQKAQQSDQSVLERRAEAVGLVQEENETIEQFEDRIVNEEYIKHMKHLGQEVKA